MSSGSDSSVIRKKALSGREDFDARAMSWSKAVRLSLERVSDRLFDLQLAVRTVEQVETPLAELRAVGSGDRLIMLLERYSDLNTDDAPSGKPGRGAAILDRALVQTLVEVQTRGQVTRAELETRAFTHTDAAVTAQLIDPVLTSVDAMMSDTPRSPDPLRLRFGDKVEDGRALILALDAPDFVQFRVTFDVEDGLRSGEMVLAIPEDMLHPPAAVPDADDPETGQFDLSGLALSAPVALNAVLARVDMPLSRVSALKRGDTLPLARSALSRTELVGSKGFVLGKVTLGQMNGFRAVRLGEGDPDETTGPALAPVTSDLAPKEDSVPSIDVEAELPEVAMTEDTAEDAPEPLPDLDALEFDAPELDDLADLSDLDDATLPASDEDLPDLPAL